MKLKVSVLIIVVALLAFSYASAALTSISLDRDVSAGMVLSDTDPNVVIKFAAGEGYASVLDITENGEISLDLSSILTSPAIGFNTEASFTIGGADKPVLKITNNSNIPVSVNLATATGGLSLEGDATINAGVEKDYYFKINTAGIAEGTDISGVIAVREAS